MTNLDFIDASASEAELTNARQLIEGELTAMDVSKPHANLPEAPAALESTNLLLHAAFPEIAKSGKANITGAVDLSRYEEPDEPEDDESEDSWNAAVRQAMVAHEALRQRNSTLALLEKYGKNSWLIANEQTENEAEALGRELVSARAELADVQRQRQERQMRAQGELEALETTWRDTIMRSVATEQATRELQAQIDVATGAKRDMADAPAEKPAKEAKTTSKKKASKK